MRFELTTPGLQDQCSATELRRPLVILAGLAHWGTIRLVKSMQIELNSLLAHDLHSHGPIHAEVCAHDVSFDPADGSLLQIATEAGNILHASTAPHHRPHPRY